MLIATALAAEPEQPSCQAAADAIMEREPEISRAEAREKACPAELWTDIEVRRRPRMRASDFPKGEKGPARCVAILTVDAWGKMTNARPVPTDTCSEAFREATLRLARRYRFEPARFDGRAEEAAFELAVNFAVLE